VLELLHLSSRKFDIDPVARGTVQCHRGTLPLEGLLRIGCYRPAAAWNAQSALLQSRLTFAGAPAAESPAGAGSAGTSDVARLEIHMQAALQNTSFNDT
jgi:hypothetical protein